MVTFTTFHTVEGLDGVPGIPSPWLLVCSALHLEGSRTMKWAIDVSSYDAISGKESLEPVDWIRARDEGGLSLAIIKVSEGLRMDTAFNLQWSAAKGILPRAAYHFFRSNINAIQQAQACWSYLSTAGFEKTDFVILDFETLDGISAPKALLAVASWLYEMEKNGVKPLLYTYPGFWQSIKGEQATWAAKYPLVLAQWPKDNWILNFSPTVFTTDRLAALKNNIQSGALKPVTLKPWHAPAIWQFSSRVDSRVLPGHPAFKKVIDYNAVFMDLPVVSAPSVDPTRDYFTLNRCPSCGQVVYVG